MNFDLFQSRRTYNEYCKWWSVKETDELEDLIYKRVPSGHFWAKEDQSETDQVDMVDNMAMYNKITISIKTPDNVYGMKSNDIVLFRNEKWIVVDVQKKQARNQQSEFANDNQVSHFWYISLRK